MKEMTCIVIGGGHAGLHAIKQMDKAWRGGTGLPPLRIVLVDRQPRHVRKVLLFKPAAMAEEITLPWEALLPEGVRFVKAAAASLDTAGKRLRCDDGEGGSFELEYDIAVVAIGSIVRHPDPEQGGITLGSPEAAVRARAVWRANMQQAAAERDPAERLRLMGAAIAGAGISGIETAAELAAAMRKEARTLRLDPADVRVYLLNAEQRLFMEGPAKVGRRLERMLGEAGVTVVNGCKAMREESGSVRLSGGSALPAGLLLWSIGLRPNPALSRLGLPLAGDGRVEVDERYRVADAPGVYSIGDCARIVDPTSGTADRMTCKEAIAQAVRLGRITAADAAGRPAPAHKAYLEGYCIGLGPDQGLAWFRHWGIDFVMGGKLAFKLKQFAWDRASLLK